MPAMQLFGRRWHLATDDFPGPALLSAAFHAAWGCALLVGASGADAALARELGCAGPAGALVALGAAFLAAALVSAALARESLRGSIADVAARRRVPGCLYALSALLAAELGLLVVASARLAAGPAECRGPSAAPGAVALVGSTWAVMAAALLGILIAFNVFGGRGRPGLGGVAGEGDAWRRRVLCVGRLLCLRWPLHEGGERVPGPRGGARPAATLVDEIADHCAHMFAGMDFTPSDLSAAIVLLHAEKKAVRGLGGAVEVTVAPAATGPRGEAERAVPPGRLSAAAHFVRFSVAVYGTPLYLYSNLGCGVCKLCCGGACALGSLARTHGNFGGGPCCNRLMDFRAILDTAGLAEADLVHCNFESRALGVLPYFVALDRETSSVVISVRGTMSLQDAVTDLNLAPEVPRDLLLGLLPGGAEAGGGADEEDFFVHGGILASARAIAEDLRGRGIFTDYVDPLVRGPGCVSVEAGGALPSPGSPRGGTGWSVVVTGHSLGAGVASILGWILRTQGYPCRCWLYSPPGCTVSRRLSKHMEGFCTSVVYNEEWSSFVSVRNVVRLNRELQSVARRAKVPKAFILWRGLFSLLCLCRRGKFHRQAYLMLMTPEEAAEREAEVEARGGAEVASAAPGGSAEDLTTAGYDMASGGSSGPGAVDAPSMFMPGEVFHVRRLGSSRVHWSKAEHAAVWSSAAAFEREGLNLSSTTLIDHVPDRIAGTLRALASECRLSGAERPQPPNYGGAVL